MPIAVAEALPLLSIDGRCDVVLTHYAAVAVRADGSFALDDLPAGELRLRSRPAAGSPAVELRAFPLARGATVTLE